MSVTDATGNSRLGSVTYPSGLQLSYTHTNLGYALGIVGPGGLAYRTAGRHRDAARTSRRARGRWFRPPASRQPKAAGGAPAPPASR